MQQFIDNWSATLLASATAADVTMSVEPAQAALLAGLGAGNFYYLTLIDRNAEGVEVAWDIVTVTGRTGGVLDVTRSATARAWPVGTVIEARLTAAALAALRDAGGSAVGSDTPQALGEASTPGTSPQASRQDHVHAMPTPAEVGAASAAEAVALAAALADKVDKVAGLGLSSNDYTTAEKNKLAGLEAGHFKGLHASLAALQAAHPTAAAGNYADVDAGAGLDVVRYLWDVSDSTWVAQAAAGGSMTAAQVKAAYESNPDTNAFTDAEQAKLGGIATGATANADTDTLAEGATNKYFTEGRVRSTVLTGLSLLAGGAISAADSLLSALGKLQKQISDAVTAIGGKQDTLVSGTNLKTVNGNSLLGGGDLTISGGAGGLENLTEVKTVAAPNATVPVVSLSVSITEANGDYAILPKGTGAIIAAIPNNAVSGGNKRGSRAVDLQLTRSAANQVASGSNAVISGGQGNIASNTNSTVGGGYGNAASGGNDAISGGLGNTSTGGQVFIGGGASNTVSAAYSAVVGGQSNDTSFAAYSFIGGGSNNTFSVGTGDYRSHLGGSGNSASAAYASTTGGRDNRASGQYSVTLGGYRASTKGVIGAVAHASGGFSVAGDAQAVRYTLRIATSNATPAVLTADGGTTPSATNSLTLSGQSAYAIYARIIARNTSTGECAAWEVSAIARQTNTASTTALVGTPTVTSLGGDAALSAASIAVSANTTLGSVTFVVTGIDATNLRWVALVETVEVG